MELLNQVIVITGAGSGMGAATALHLATQGAKIALLDIDEEKLIEISKEIGGFPILCDVANSENAEHAIQKVIEHYDGIHGVINCAGIAPAKRMVGREGAMPLNEFSRVIQINLVGTFNIMRLCAQQMVKQNPVNADGERGVIINTASIAAYEGQIGQSAYSASKGGIVSMTLPLARELAQFGIRVMTIAPGIIHTPLLSAMPEKVQQSLAEGVPFPKRLGSVREYAELVEYIIKNAYLNGSVIRLDGALRMQG